MMCFIRIRLNEPALKEAFYNPVGDVVPTAHMWPNLAAASRYPMADDNDISDDQESTDDGPNEEGHIPDVKPEILIESVYSENKTNNSSVEEPKQKSPKAKQKSNVYFLPDYSCKVCKKVFPSAPKLNIHTQTCQPPETKRKSFSSKKKRKIETPGFKCQICLKEFDEELVLLKHMENAHGIKDSRYQCAQCYQFFPSLNMLQEHPCVTAQGFGEPAVVPEGFECALCKLMFTCKDDHDLHWDEAHGPRFPCNRCTKQFRTQSELNKHLRKHVANTCDVCGKTFKFKSIMKKHKETVHRDGEAPTMPCEICGKLYKGENCLKEHCVAVHNSPGRFKCSECGKEFWLAKRLEMHMRNHTGEKPYQCSECGKAFPLASSLYVHSKRHTTERNYKCKLCDKTYTTKYYLKEHMDKHDPARAVMCDLCGKSFKSKWFLKMHKEIHMNRRIYKCEICGTAYNNSGSLYTHKKKHMTE